MTVNMRLIISFLLMSIAHQAFALEPELPMSPEQRYSDRVVIACVKKQTAGMELQFKKLGQELSSLRKANMSVAPTLRNYRRLEEEWCAVEAQCVSGSVKENKEFIYGETFSFCLQH